MDREFEGRRITGKIASFDPTTNSGTVTVDDKEHEFHSSSYSSRSARAPQPNDTVEVVLVDEALLEVREKRD